MDVVGSRTNDVTMCGCSSAVGLAHDRDRQTKHVLFDSTGRHLADDMIRLEPIRKRVPSDELSKMDR